MEYNLVTELPTFSCSLLNKERFNSLSVNEQKIFESLRNSCLEIFPNDNGKYPDETTIYAENFAFIGLKTFGMFYSTMIEERLNILEESLNKKITELSASMTTASSASSVTGSSSLTGL